MSKLTVRTWQTSGLHGYPKRLRKNDGAVDSMVKSIETYGFKIPVLITEEGEVIDGHLRLKAAEKMGWAELPVIVCDDWSAEQIRGFRLMANESSNWAEWDLDEVAKELGELEALDFNLDFTGFDDLVIEDLLGDLFPDDSIAAIPHEPERCPVCQRKLTKKRKGVR